MSVTPESSGTTIDILSWTLDSREARLIKRRLSDIYPSQLVKYHSLRDLAASHGRQSQQQATHTYGVVILVISRSLVEYITQSHSAFSVNTLTSSKVKRFYTLDDSVRGLHQNYYDCVLEWQERVKWQHLDPQRGFQYQLTNIVSYALKTDDSDQRRDGKRGQFEIFPNKFNGLEASPLATVIIDQQIRRPNHLGWVFRGTNIEVFLRSRSGEITPINMFESKVIGVRYTFMIPDNILSTPGTYMLNILDRQPNGNNEVEAKTLGTRRITILPSQVQSVSAIIFSKGFLKQLTTFHTLGRPTTEESRDMDSALTSLYQEHRLPLIAFSLHCENPTLLHVACRYNLLKLATLLCDTANTNVDNKTFDRICLMPDRSGRNCKQIAKELGHDGIHSMIIRKQSSMDQYVPASRPRSASSAGSGTNDGYVTGVNVSGKVARCSSLVSKPYMTHKQDASKVNASGVSNEAASNKYTYVENCGSGFEGQAFKRDSGSDSVEGDDDYLQVMPPAPEDTGNLESDEDDYLEGYLPMSSSNSQTTSSSIPGQTKDARTNYVNSEALAQAGADSSYPYDYVDGFNSLPKPSSS